MPMGELSTGANQGWGARSRQQPHQNDTTDVPAADGAGCGGGALPKGPGSGLRTMPVRPSPPSLFSRARGGKSDTHNPTLRPRPQGGPGRVPRAAAPHHPGTHVPMAGARGGECPAGSTQVPHTPRSRTLRVAVEVAHGDGHGQNPATSRVPACPLRAPVLHGGPATHRISQGKRAASAAQHASHGGQHRPPGHRRRHSSQHGLDFL